MSSHIGTSTPRESNPPPDKTSTRIETGFRFLPKRAAATLGSLLRVGVQCFWG